MKWLIRIAWFALTFAIYVPVRSALDSAGAAGFVVFIFHLVYFLFVFLVPCRAFVSIYESRTKPAPAEPEPERLCLTSILQHSLYPGAAVFSDLVSRIISSLRRFFRSLDIEPTAFQLLFLSLGVLHCIPEVHRHQLVRTEMCRALISQLVPDPHSPDRSAFAEEAEDFLFFLLYTYGEEVTPEIRIRVTASSYSHARFGRDIDLDSKKNLVHEYWLLARYISDVLSGYEILNLHHS